MSERSAMFLIVVGLLMALGGTGAIDTAVSDADLLSSLAVAVVGVLVMGCGTLGVQNSKYFG